MKHTEAGHPPTPKELEAVSQFLSAFPDVKSEEAVKELLRRLSAAETERDEANAAVTKLADEWAEQGLKLDRAEARVEALTKQAMWAVEMAEHLFSMIDRETWRATGGDDGQGHYEGDYHAVSVETRLRVARAALSAGQKEQQ